MTDKEVAAYTLRAVTINFTINFTGFCYTKRSSIVIITGQRYIDIKYRDKLI